MRIRYILFIALLLGFIAACAPNSIKIKAGIDTPDHHVQNGMRLLESGKTEDAYREFIRAKELNPDYPPAYVGLGLVAGMQGQVEKGLEIIKAAINLMRNQNTETKTSLNPSSLP
jgi:tetratricopeptide (TPR) repeat protein